MTSENKIKIYCAFTGLGKTYYCQHNLGWIDIDEEAFIKTRNPEAAMIQAFYAYHNYGYKILTNGTPYVLESLYHHRDEFEVILMIPSPNMKEEILQRIRDRGSIEWANMLPKYYDNMYKYAYFYPCETKYMLRSGQYVSDVLKMLD